MSPESTSHRLHSDPVQFVLDDVEVVVATVDIQEVRAHRSSSSRSLQAAKSSPYRRVRCEMRVGTEDPVEAGEMEVTQKGEFRYNSPEEEIA